MENTSKRKGNSKFAAGLQVIKNYGRRYAYLLFLALPFFAMEAGIKLIGRNVNYFRAAMVFPNILFILIWTGLIVGVTNCLAGRAAKIFYNLVFVVFFVMYIVHGAYFEISNYFFGFSLLESASEGSSYILDAIQGLRPWFYVTLAVILFLFFFAKAHTPGWKKTNCKSGWGNEPQAGKHSEKDVENIFRGKKEKKKSFSGNSDSEKRENFLKDRWPEKRDVFAKDKDERREKNLLNRSEKKTGKNFEERGLKKSTRWRELLILLAVFALLHTITPIFYGAANEDLEWDTWRNPHNVYENFNDSNKCMLICGLMEYTVRDLYVTYFKPAEAEDEEELAILEEAYSTSTAHKENELTGIFEGKNVIFLQMEGMDSWLITEEDTPNLYALMNNSIVFENHYSYFTGGGSTFNSELAVNTGFITPISYTKNPYSFTTNSFPYSLARMFGTLDYAVNCFHMNTEEYYQRGINYKNWGYDHYYSLLDENNYSDLSYELDRELILDEDFYDRLFTQYAFTVTEVETEDEITDTGTDDEKGGAETQSGTVKNADEEGSSATTPAGDTEGSDATAPTGDAEGNDAITPTGDTEGNDATAPTGDTEGSDVTAPTGDTEGSDVTAPTGDTEGNDATTPTGDTEGSDATAPTGDAEGNDATAQAGDAGEKGVTTQTEEDENHFAHYIITYTPHTPFVTDRGVGQYLAELIYGDDIPEMDEEAVARMMAGETDYMVGLLIQALKDNGLYENTVIVAYADHYLYTLSDETILEKYKTTENNLINQTPFFIWSSDVAEIAEELLSAETENTEDNSLESDDSGTGSSGGTGFAGGTILDGQGTVKLLADGSVSIRISKVNSQIDILPTVLNLFGIAYEDEYYVGSDIFDKNYSGYVFFSDYSWYNGSVYASGSDDYQILNHSASDDTNISETQILNLFTKISDLIQINDLTLKYDYLRRVY